MGALAPVSSWIPEDDLLLKNAVEAGASLESLAKGAVQFSRRFTLRELQERWFSLLYDPVVSAEASARVLEFERSTSTLPSKFSRFGKSKDNKSVTGKRKAESVRNCYYALRKRVSSEPFDSMDPSFLLVPTNGTYIGNRGEPLSGNCIPGNPISNPFGLGVSGMDTMTHAFPNTLMDGGAATVGDATITTLPTGLQNPVEENFLIEQNKINKEIPCILGENMPPKDLSENSVLKAVDLGMKSPPAFDQVNGDQSNMCLEFENKVFSSPFSGCVAPFNNMEHSSPLPGMPIWKTDFAPALPVDIGLGDKHLCLGDSYHLPDDYDAGNARTSGCHSGAKVKMEMTYDDFQIHNSPEGYLAELSNSLLNFTNEEELLFMNADGKDMIDKSYYDGLSSILLNSPNDASQEQANNITETETSVAAAVCTKNLFDQCHADPHDNKGSSNCDEQMSYDAQTLMQESVSARNSQFPEYNKDGVICCTLNTEDPEIPCNDDVLLLNLPPSKASTGQQKFQGANKPISSSLKDFFTNQRTSNKGPSLMHEERKTAGESHVSSQMIGSHVIQDMGLNLLIRNFGIKPGVSKSDSANVASRVAGISRTGIDQINTVNTSTKTLLPEKRKEETKEMLKSKHLSSTDCSMKRSALGSASVKSYAYSNSIVIKEEHDVSTAIRDQEPIYHAELTSMNVAVSEPVVNAPRGDQDGPSFESDYDIPCYSDIEAMILDMDLDPNDQELNSCAEVTRYQHEGTKREIIRLEQSAHSFMQRAIASRGALAILYGRRSKHYIKKPEVLIGRATEDMNVDIDLGREGRTNKISRKQAIIRMDKSGSFHLKNLGKSSISVNGREVGPKQSINLNSGCLIEIRQMPFIFETNQTQVKMYLDSIAKNPGTQKQQF